MPNEYGNNIRKVVIVLPTYNERENITLLIPRIRWACSELPYEVCVLVVDDNSPDGTSNAVRELQEKCENIYLINGEKQGLGVAYKRGIRYAITQLGADVVMEMDSDFSHDPNDIPRLLSKLESSDFVIGSRYIPGGSIPDEWGFVRKANSRWGNIFARYVAGIPRVRDCTAGFRAIRTSVINGIDIESIEGNGYSFQISLLYNAIASGAHVVEVPVIFTDRNWGESKLGIADIVEFVLLALSIRLSSSRTFLRFFIVGTIGLFINLGALTVFLAFGINKFIASPIAIEISIIANFLLNNYWTFARRPYDTRFHLRGLRFNVVSIFALGVSYGTFVFVTFLIPTVLPQVAQAIGVVPAMFVNYFLHSYWTFRAKA
jgi:dolichol-phosphate mannosyltransferase